MTYDELLSEVKNFIDEDGRITAMPSKRKKQLILVYYMAQKIEKGRRFTTREINDVINGLHTFNDFCVWRRDLCDLGFLSRERDGSSYIMAENQPTIEDLGLE